LANIESAKKRIRQSLKRRARNQAIRSRTKTYVKQARVILDDGSPEEQLEAVRRAISELDRAVAKGVIHRNNADRRKQRLMKRLQASFTTQ
jgi:small subunit ribosomal protein S20